MPIHTRHNGYNHAVPSDITPASLYLQRRAWLQHMATGVAGQ